MLSLRNLFLFILFERVTSFFESYFKYVVEKGEAVGHLEAEDSLKEEISSSLVDSERKYELVLKVKRSEIYRGAVKKKYELEANNQIKDH